MKAFTKKHIEFKAHKDGFIIDRSEMIKRKTRNSGESTRLVLVTFKQGELI